MYQEYIMNIVYDLDYWLQPIHCKIHLDPVFFVYAVYLSPFQ